MNKQKPVTEEEAQQFYNQNKNRLKGNFKDVKSRLIRSLQSRQHQQLAQAFIQQLKKRADTKVFLRESTFAVASDDDPVRGGGRDSDHC
jgi:rubrerythrin